MFFRCSGSVLAADRVVGADPVRDHLDLRRHRADPASPERDHRHPEGGKPSPVVRDPRAPQQTRPHDHLDTFGRGDRPRRRPPGDRKPAQARALHVPRARELPVVLHGQSWRTETAVHGLCPARVKLFPSSRRGFDCDRPLCHKCRGERTFPIRPSPPAARSNCCASGAWVFGMKGKGVFVHRPVAGSPKSSPMARWLPAARE
jgi:hypothetical protein